MQVLAGDSEGNRNGTRQQDLERCASEIRRCVSNCKVYPDQIQGCAQGELDWAELYLALGGTIPELISLYEEV